MGTPDELPSRDARRELSIRNLIAFPVGEWAFVLCTPYADREAVLRANYWPLVAAATKRFGPAVVDRLSAVRLYTGDASIYPLLDMRHAASRSNWTREVVPDASIVLRPDDVAPPLPTHTVSVVGVAIPVLAPATLLLTLTLGDVEMGMAHVAPWVRSLTLTRAALVDAYDRRPRPVLLKRIGHLSGDLGNTRLAETVEWVLSRRNQSALPRGLTGVGVRVLVPKPAHLVRTRGTAWQLRYADLFAKAAEQVGTPLRDVERAVSRDPWPTTLAAAREAQPLNTYHSTAIEGYAVTPDLVERALKGSMRGRRRGVSGQDGASDVELAVRGHAAAFEKMLAFVGVHRTRVDSNGEIGTALPLEASQLLTLYRALWAPARAAGRLAAHDGRGWRRRPVLIGGSYHVPPESNCVADLMQMACDQANAIRGPIARAVFVHWATAHVHPFHDGNGRVARLLMQAVFCDAGLPVATIRVQERMAYVRALEWAHREGDLRPLADVVNESAVRGKSTDTSTSRASANGGAA